MSFVSWWSNGNRASQVYLYFSWFIINHALNHALINLTSIVGGKYLVTKPVWCYCFNLIMMFLFNQGDVASYTVSNHSRMGSRSQGHTEALLSKKQTLKLCVCQRDCHCTLSQFHQRILTQFQGNNNTGRVDNISISLWENDSFNIGTDYN